jgi:hypothetical protein
MPFVDGAIGLVPYQLLNALALGAHDGALPRLDPLHVDADLVAEHDTKFGGPSRQMGGAGAGHQGFGGRATGVDAGAAEQLALHDRDLRPGLNKAEGKERPGLTSTDDDCVEAAAHGVGLWLRLLDQVRPGRRVVTSWTIHILPSGSLNAKKDP